MRVKDEFAGRKVRCPACQAVVTVPVPAADAADVDDAALGLLLREDEKAAPTPRRPAWEDRGPSRPPSEPAIPPKLPAPVPAPPPKKKKRTRSDDDESRFRGISISPTIITGLLMMLGAAVWFFGALAVGIIFFYPPILFVLGLITFCKGLLGHED
jgi:hypothetical protein